MNKVEKYRNVADKVLFDSGKGSGKAINLSVLFPKNIDILAGGLGTHNIESVLKKVSPDIVDANSKLELSPGKKDIKLVKEFINKVRNEKIIF